MDASTIKPLALGSLTIWPPVLLAPMAGYSDLPFRISIRELGGLGMAYTEMLSPKSILFGGGRKRKAILGTCPEDRPLGYQLYGHEAAILAEAARWLVQRGAELIDLNMGCPQPKIAGRGAGGGLLKDTARALDVARQVVAAVRVPVTAKLRLGWDASSHVADRLAKDLEQAGVAAITVHGRTCGQKYLGHASWQGIREVVQAVERIPVIGNGDLTSPEAARRMIEETGCAGVMLARGALKDPWLIRDIGRDLSGEPPLPPPTHADRVVFMRQHFERNLAHHGEDGGVVMFRKWIPQYARAVNIERQHMVKMLRICDLGEMREELSRL